MKTQARDTLPTKTRQYSCFFDKKNVPLHPHFNAYIRLNVIAHSHASSETQHKQAPVAKLVDAPDLGSGGLRCVGSSPIGRTKCRPPNDWLSIIRRPYSYLLIPIPNKKRHTIWLKNRLYAGLSLKLLTFAECICKKMKSLFTYIRFWFYITLEKLGLRRSSPSSRSKGKGDCQ